jgi:hypothetical protein
MMADPAVDGRMLSMTSLLTGTLQAHVSFHTKLFKDITPLGVLFKRVLGCGEVMAMFLITAYSHQVERHAKLLKKPPHTLAETNPVGYA